MDKQKLKTVAIAVAAVAVVGVGTYAYTASSMKPAVAQVAQTGCGPVASWAGFGVPLATIKTAAPTFPVTYGPLATPSIGGDLRITFDARVSGTSRELKLEDGALRLPVAFGGKNIKPETIRFTCRDGALATVRYQSGREFATFNITRPETG
jgi:hypothetical protein